MHNPLPRIPKIIDESAATADVRRGFSATAIKHKYGIGWERAKEIVRSVVPEPLHFPSVDPGDLPAGHAPRSSESRFEPPGEDPYEYPAANEPADWELIVRVSAERADAIVSTFTLQEILATFSLEDKMDCIAAALQHRLDLMPLLIPQLHQPNPESEPPCTTSPR